MSLHVETRHTITPSLLFEGSATFNHLTPAKHYNTYRVDAFAPSFLLLGACIHQGTCIVLLHHHGWTGHLSRNLHALRVPQNTIFTHKRHCEHPKTPFSHTKDIGSTPKHHFHTQKTSGAPQNTIFTHKRHWEHPKTPFSHINGIGSTPNNATKLTCTRLYRKCNIMFCCNIVLQWNLSKMVPV